jgi:hypothetical protein
LEETSPPLTTRVVVWIVVWIIALFSSSLLFLSSLSSSSSSWQRTLLSNQRNQSQDSGRAAFESHEKKRVWKKKMTWQMFRVWMKRRETALGYKKAKTNRTWVQILHFYHAKTVNTDMRRIHVPNTNLGRHERN